jgi:hypothetical protein
MPYTHTPFGVLRFADAGELLRCPSDELDHQVLKHSRRWQVVGIFLRCVTCGESQKASDSARPFAHLDGCQTHVEDFP